MENGNMTETEVICKLFVNSFFRQTRTAACLLPIISEWKIHGKIQSASAKISVQQEDTNLKTKKVLQKQSRRLVFQSDLVGELGVVTTP